MLRKPIGLTTPYRPVTPVKDWTSLARGVRVDGYVVVITAKGNDNDAARELCGALIAEMEKRNAKKK